MSVLSDTIKGFLICFCIFLLWSAGCFFCGYIFSNSRAVEQLNKANKQLAAQQQKYDELIRDTDERIRNIKEELRGQITNNGQAVAELSKLIEQIKKQRIDL